MQTFNLPDLGEGLPDATIVKWHIKVGDIVTSDQVLVTLESAKSTVDIPSFFVGKIIKLFGNEEDTIPTGTPLFGYEEKNSLQNNPKPQVEKSSENAPIVGEFSSESDVLVHSETNVISTTKRKMTAKARVLLRKHNITVEKLSIFDRIIVEEDVLDFIQKMEVPQNQPYTERTNKYETPLTGMRLAMAHNMKRSQEEVIPVTCSKDANIDHWSKKSDITVNILQAIAYACQKNPIINAFFDKQSLSYSLNKKINVGLALDTPHGLYVPVIHDVAAKNPEELRTCINDLKKKGFEKKLSYEEMHSPTILLSNFGTLGTTFATPVIVPPIVAIVGVGKSFSKVIINEGETLEKNFLPIVLTTNHYLITGGEASGFLNSLIEKLETNYQHEKNYVRRWSY